MTTDWTHFDGEGRPVMVDVGGKSAATRRASAECWVDLTEAVYEAVRGRQVLKGDPISVCELGGIMGAKRTPEIIPLCHNIRLESVKVRCELRSDGSDETARRGGRPRRFLRIECEAAAKDVTGVEMEALTGASVAALVFYDMCKALDKGLVIRDLRLIEKSGGKSGDWSGPRSELFQETRGE
ncbi:MAG: cyclic pyranopterin monophosphate synthase MoaC [Synergistaceae bacterium]|jgi:cyclic pyranopterin phosphate synthase|nr:cyclic pyranopterin monophosphate synthase MoaC [Synergistaceae bacterium]